MNELTLDGLAKRINEAHKKCAAVLRDGLRHAVVAGNLLREAKTRCKHGEWTAWLESNCEVSVRSAQAYMRAAKVLPSLSESKTQSVADLSLGRALSQAAREKQKAECLRRLEAGELKLPSPPEPHTNNWMGWGFKEANDPVLAAEDLLKTFSDEFVRDLIEALEGLLAPLEKAEAEAIMAECGT